MAGQDRSAKDKQRASYLKTHKIERTTGVCPVCYATISIDCPSKGTRYHHKCGMKSSTD